MYLDRNKIEIVVDDNIKIWGSNIIYKIVKFIPDSTGFVFVELTRENYAGSWGKNRVVLITDIIKVI